MRGFTFKELNEMYRTFEEALKMYGKVKRAESVPAHHVMYVP